MTITEFLTARYDEEEAVARRDQIAASFVPDGETYSWDDENYRIVASATYVLADIAAKRAIVALHPAEGIECGQCSFHELYEGFNDVSEAWPCYTLRLLAQPYAEHPDFDPEWRAG